MKYPTWILVHHVSKEKKIIMIKLCYPNQAIQVWSLKFTMYLHWFDPPKNGYPSKIFDLFQFEKKETTLLFVLVFLHKGDWRLFFRVFLGFPPGSEIQQNIQANESDCECFMGLCDRFGGENHKSLIFWVWPLTGCQWSQDYCIISRDSYINLHLPLLLREGPTPNLSFKQKSLWTKTCLLVI